MTRPAIALYTILFSVAFIAPICLAVTDLSNEGRGAKINSSAKDSAVSISSGSEMSLYGSGCFTLNSSEAMFVPTKTSGEWTSFHDWAVARPDLVTFGACAGSCGDGSCGAGETCANCAGDCGACPGACSSADLVPQYAVEPDASCVAQGCTGGMNMVRLCYSFDKTNCSDPVPLGGCMGCPEPVPGPGGPTTPYLFSAVGEKYVIENDVMETTKDQHYAVARQAYERNTGDPLKLRPTDYYKLRLKPEVGSNGIKFQIRELEPEESHIDQVRLLRIIHPKGTYVFADQETSAIKAVREEMPSAPVACTMGTGDCLDAVARLDDIHVEAGKDASMSLTFDLTGKNTKDLYLTLNAWEKPVLKPETAPFKAKAGSLVPVLLIDPDHPDKTIRLKDLHPRAIAMRMDIALGDALKDFKGKTLMIRLLWTEHHFVDYVALLESQPAQVRQEELPLTGARHSSGTDERGALLAKDNLYVHTVRGDVIDLTFAAPREAITDKEAETYFFVASGFYHGLRTYLHPKVDASEASFRRELKIYVDELNDVLQRTTDGRAHETR